MRQFFGCAVDSRMLRHLLFYRPSVRGLDIRDPKSAPGSPLNGVGCGRVPDWQRWALCRLRLRNMRCIAQSCESPQPLEPLRIPIRHASPPSRRANDPGAVAGTRQARPAETKRHVFVLCLRAGSCRGRRTARAAVHHHPRLYSYSGYPINKRSVAQCRHGSDC